MTALSMTCYFPLHAYKDIDLKDRAKNVITFKRTDSWRGERLELPCGQCIGCRLERSRIWAVRCVHEASLYEKNCFVTLTYSNENLPKDGSLCLRDFQLFMKRLRKRYGRFIRYYHCGEYGDSLQRPHYHALLFNCDFEDKRGFIKKGGIQTFTSESLSDLWKKGFSIIGEVNFQSAGYVARYCLKKVTGKKASDYYGSLKAEYSTMSRKPGIGKGWFDRYAGDVYPLDRIVIDGRIMRSFRYYDDLFGKIDPAEMARLKIEREKNERFVTDMYKGKVIKVSDSSDIRLAVKEKVKKAQISFLNRHKGW